MENKQKKYVNLGYGNATFHITKTNCVKQLKVYANDNNNTYVVVLDFEKVKEIIKQNENS